jgi:glutamyl-tRNA reductase
VDKVLPEGAGNGQVLYYNPIPNTQQVLPDFSTLVNAWETYNLNQLKPSLQATERITPTDLTKVPMGLFVDPASCSKPFSQNNTDPKISLAVDFRPGNSSSQNTSNGATTAVQKALNDGASTFQKNIIQPVQKALNDGASSVKKNIIQPAQKELKKVTTYVQQKVIQPVQKALNNAPTVVQQKVVQPVQKALNDGASSVKKNIIQPVQKALNNAPTVVQQKVISQRKIF